MINSNLSSKLISMVSGSLLSCFIESFFNIIVSESVKRNKKQKLRSLIRVYIKKYFNSRDIHKSYQYKQEIDDLLKIIKIYFFDLDNPNLVNILKYNVESSLVSEDSFLFSFISLIKEIKKYLSLSDLSDIDDQWKRDVFKSINYKFMEHIDNYSDNIDQFYKKINTNESDQSLNAFDYRLTKTFIGRTTEIENIIKFCNDDSVFKWWILTADGGVGKSKLLFEIKTKQNYYKLEEWKILFYNPNDFLEYNNLFYNKNLLLIIDYYAKYRFATERLLSRIQNLNKAKKIRVLLIERKAFENLIDFDKSCIFNPSPLQINILSDGENLTLANNYVNEVLESKNCSIAINKELIINKAINELKNDNLKRPLILLLLLRYYLEGGTGDLEDAFNKHVKKYHDQLEYYFGDSEFFIDSKRLMVLSTIVGSFPIDISSVSDNNSFELTMISTLIKFCKSDNKKIANICKCLNGIYMSDTRMFIFGKIEPDIFGEAFVLSYWTTMEDQEFFNLLGSEKYCQELFEFLIRLIDDIQFVKIYANYNVLYAFFNKVFNFISLESAILISNGFEEAFNSVLNKTDTSMDSIHRIFYLSVISFRILTKLLDLKKNYSAITKELVLMFSRIALRTCEETYKMSINVFTICSDEEKEVICEILQKAKETVENIGRYREALK